MGRRDFISVGNDFDTKDGTSVRDYIHVMDLADGHLAALKKLQEKPKHYAVYNLGIGEGTSVREMIQVHYFILFLLIKSNHHKKEFFFVLIQYSFFVFFFTAFSCETPRPWSVLPD